MENFKRKMMTMNPKDKEEKMKIQIARKDMKWAYNILTM